MTVTSVSPSTRYVETRRWASTRVPPTVVLSFLLLALVLGWVGRARALHQSRPRDRRACGQVPRPEHRALVRHRPPRPRRVRPRRPRHRLLGRQRAGRGRHRRPGGRHHRPARGLPRGLDRRLPVPVRRRAPRHPQLPAGRRRGQLARLPDHQRGHRDRCVGGRRVRPGDALGGDHDPPRRVRRGVLPAGRLAAGTCSAGTSCPTPPARCWPWPCSSSGCRSW